MKILFGDVYKRANDRIDTKAPYERMMKRLEKAPRKISIVRKVEYTAALAACVGLTFFGMNAYNKSLPKDPISEAENAIIYTKEKAADIAVPEIGNADVIPQPEETLKPTQKPKIKAVQKPTEAPKIAEEKKIEETAAPHPAVTQEPVQNQPAVAAATDAETMPKSSGGGGGGASRAMQNTKTLTKDEYMEYLGKSFAMPMGYNQTNRDTKNFVLSENGEILDDSWHMIFENGEKTAEVTFSKNLAGIRGYFEANEITEISGIDAVIIEESADVRAYIIIDDVALEITADNRLDIEDIIKNFAK